MLSTLSNLNSGYTEHFHELAEAYEEIIEIRNNC